MSQSLITLGSSIASGLLSATELVTLTGRQLKTVAMIKDFATSNELDILTMSHDKTVKSIVVSAKEKITIASTCEAYKASKNPTEIFRLLTGLIGVPASANPPCLKSAKHVDLAEYQSQVEAWIMRNAKNEPRTMRTQEIYRERANFLAPIFVAIGEVLAVETKGTPKQLTTA